MFLLLRTQLSSSSNRLRRLEGSQSRAEDSLELMQESHDRLEELCERLCEQQKIDLATSHSRPARRERKGSFVRSGSGSADRLLAARFTARASSQPNLLAPINRGGSVSAVQGQSSVADVRGLGGGDSTSNRGGGGGGGAAPAVVPKRMATGGAVKLKLGLDEYLERVRRKCRERKLACEVGNHPIYSRVRWNRMDEVMRLLDEGFDINEPDDRGNTVLHIACQNGHEALIKLFVVLNADLNTKNMTGQTALHFTRMYGYEKLFRYLTSRGANPAIRNNGGVAARDAEEPTTGK